MVASYFTPLASGTALQPRVERAITEARGNAIWEYIKTHYLISRDVEILISARCGSQFDVVATVVSRIGPYEQGGR